MSTTEACVSRCIGGKGTGRLAVWRACASRKEWTGAWQNNHDEPCKMTREGCSSRQNAFIREALPPRLILKVEPEFDCFRPRRHIVRPTERGQEVV